jgi:hypothetical protein
LHQLNRVSRSSHAVPSHQTSAISSVPITTPFPSANTTLPSVTKTPFSNAHHVRFSSALSSLAPSPTMAPITSSSRISKLLAPSHLQPPVTTIHRLSSWSSPYALRQRRQLESTLPFPR